MIPDKLVTAAAEAVQKFDPTLSDRIATVTARRALAAAFAALPECEEAGYLGVDDVGLYDPDYYVGWDNCLAALARMGKNG